MHAKLAASRSGAAATLGSGKVVNGRWQRKLTRRRGVGVAVTADRVGPAIRNDNSVAPSKTFKADHGKSSVEILSNTSHVSTPPLHPLRSGAVALTPTLSSIETRRSSVIAGSAASTPAPAATWKGAKLKPLSYSALVGLILWVAPAPAGVTTQAWHLLAIFISTIVGIITQPLPLGAVAFMGLGACLLTNTLKFNQAFSAFNSEIPWLIALAFFFRYVFAKMHSRWLFCSCLKDHGG